MPRTHRARVFAALAIASIAAGALSACAPAAEETASVYPDLTLAQTKAPTQLLRNEAANRIPAKLIDGILASKDVSSACKTEETDPEGLIRSWRSSVRIGLKANDKIKVESVVAALNATFIKQGWEQGSYGAATIVELTSPQSAVVIHISTKAANEETGAGAEVQIQTGGPCVQTAGTESDEVKKLEVEAAAETE